MTSKKPAFLLDVNVLLALIDAMHQHHEPAWAWFRATGRAAFATCPIVENGVLRIASSNAYPNRSGDVQTVRESLCRLAEEPGFRFWSDSVSLRNALKANEDARSNEVTDLYLVALAAANGGRLATFDTNLRPELLAKASTVELLLRH